MIVYHCSKGKMKVSQANSTNRTHNSSACQLLTRQLLNTQLVYSSTRKLVNFITLFLQNQSSDGAVHHRQHRIVQGQRHGYFR